MEFRVRSKLETRNSHLLPLPKQVRVHLFLGLAKGHVRCPLAHPFLAVVALRALHDVHGLQIEVAAVGVGGIVGERDPIEGIDATGGAILPAAAFATKVNR